MGFLDEVKTKIFEAKFILEQDKTVTGNEAAIEKLRNALDLCTVAERLIDVLAPKAQSHVIDDTLSASLADPKFTTEPPTTKDKP
jgi:hypothetical protein